MKWADRHIAELKGGRSVVFRPSGHSMEPHIHSRQEVTVVPYEKGEGPQPGDIVLCSIGVRQYLHFVRMVQGERVLIGNARGRINGWTSRNKVYGKVVKVV